LPTGFNPFKSFDFLISRTWIIEYPQWN